MSKSLHPHLPHYSPAQLHFELIAKPLLPKILGHILLSGYKDLILRTMYWVQNSIPHICFQLNRFFLLYTYTEHLGNVRQMQADLYLLTFLFFFSYDCETRQ